MNPKCNVVCPIYSITILLSKDNFFLTVEERVLFLSGDPSDDAKVTIQQHLSEI